MCGFKFLFWGQVAVQGLFLCVLGTNMALNLVNIREIRASTIKLFYKLTAILERLSEKVHATILWVPCWCLAKLNFLDQLTCQTFKGNQTNAKKKASVKTRYY